MGSSRIWCPYITLAAVLVGFALMCGFEVAVGGHHRSHGEQSGIGHLGDHQHLGGREVHTHGDGEQHFHLGHQVLGQSDRRVNFHERDNEIIEGVALTISI